MKFNVRTLILPLTMAAALATASTASAADYVQTGGALTFASEYQGETFVGSFRPEADISNSLTRGSQSGRLSEEDRPHWCMRA